MIKKLSK